MSMPKAPTVEEPEVDDLLEMKIEIAVAKYQDSMPFQTVQEPQEE